MVCGRINKPTEIYRACSPSDVADCSSKLSQCVKNLASWMQSNQLQPDSDKTQFVWCATGQRQHQLPIITLVTGSTSVKSVFSVHDLGIFVDSDLQKRTHVCRIVRHCLAARHQPCSTRSLVSVSVITYLDVIHVLFRLNYGNGTLIGLPV
jgi:hypothetical protein